MVQPTTNCPKTPLNFKGSICSEMRGSITPKCAQLLNGAYRKGASLAVAISAHKHTRVTLKAGIDHYHKLWGIEDKQAYWGACRFDFVF